MATIKEFEDLEMWQDTRLFCNKIYIHVKDIKDYSFKDQIQRSSVSIMNNIAEGFERSSDADFCKFLVIAKSSAGEVRSMLYLAGNFSYITIGKRDELIQDCKKIAIKIKKLITYLQSNIKTIRH